MQAIEAIRAAAERGESLTRQLLDLLAPPAIDAGGGRSARAHRRGARHAGAARCAAISSFVIDIEDKIWPVEVDLGELELALVNIAVNARDAMPDGGTLTLCRRATCVLERRLGRRSRCEGEFVALAVIDTGTGMPPDVLARVFEPFFTTKPVGKGTGLGLSQVYGFANQSGGAVTVDERRRRRAP